MRLLKRVSNWVSKYQTSPYSSRAKAGTQPNSAHNFTGRKPQFKGEQLMKTLAFLLVGILTTTIGSTSVANSGNRPIKDITVAITSPVQYQTFQRDDYDQVDIDVTGTYTGNAKKIHYRVDGVDWEMLDLWPSEGEYSGTIPNVGVGDHTIEVRAVNAPHNIVTVENIRVGDVFGWIGQSNQVGHFTNPQTYTGEAASVFDEDGVWKDLQTGYRHSLLPLLASLLEEEIEIPVAFIATTKGGTGLVYGAQWIKGGEWYDKFLDTVIDSDINDLTAFLWYQGERDIRGGTTETEYAAAETQMLDDLQADTGFPDAIMISAMMAQFSGQPDYKINAIRAAKMYNWEYDPDIFPGPTGHDQSFLDGLHWKTDAEAQTLAGRWFRTITGTLYGGAESVRSAQFDSMTYSGDTVTVFFVGGEGELVNQTDETGWKVTDYKGARVILSATGTEDTVVLTLDQVLVAPVTVSFGSGNDAVGATLQDSGTYPLPPEPFVYSSASP